MNKRRWLAVWAVWLFAAGAQAQVSAADKAAAEALFDRGLALMKEGKLEEACTRFEQSNNIEHGIGTMLYLADCYEQSGRTASAWALFREASSEAQAAGQLERAQAGRQRAARLEPNLSRLVIEVPQESRVAGLEVTRNGAVIPKGLWGEALPVDPGEARIEVRAPGHVAHTQSVTIEKGANVKRVELPKLEAAPADALPTPEPAPKIEVQPAAPVTSALTTPVAQGTPVAEPRGKTQRIVGIALGGAGVAMLAVAVGMSVRAMNKNDDANCKSGDCSNGNAKLNNDAYKAANVATASYAIGGSLLAGGLLTYLIAPKSETRVAVSIDHQTAALAVGGVF